MRERRQKAERVTLGNKTKTRGSEKKEEKESNGKFTIGMRITRAKEANVRFITQQEKKDETLEVRRYMENAEKRK